MCNPPRPKDPCKDLAAGVCKRLAPDFCKNLAPFPAEARP